MQRISPFAGLAVTLLAMIVGSGLPDFSSVAAEAQDAPQIRPVARLGGFSDWVTSVAFSPDGRWLAAGSYDETRLFDAASRKQIAVLKGKAGFVQGLEFTPDGRQLLTGGYRLIRVWDVETQKQTAEITGLRGYVTSLDFDPEGKRLAASCDDETVRIYSFPEGKQQLEIRSEDRFPFQSVMFSPDGKLLATAEGDEDRVTRPGKVKIWDAGSGEMKWELPEHTKVSNSVAFSPDGRLLVSTSDDETVSVHDPLTGKGLGFYKEHGRPTNDALFAPDSQTVISGGGGRAKGKNLIKIWNRTDGSEYATLEAHAARVEALALHPDGKTLASGGYDNTVLLWDISGALPAAESGTDAPADPEPPKLPETASDTTSENNSTP